MSKKLLNKVISAILVLAICSTAFLGGVVSAAEATKNVTVAVENVGCDEIANGSTVYADVTLSTSEADAFVAGIFTVKADGLSLANANVTAATAADGTTNLRPRMEQNISTTEGKVLFQGWDEDVSLTDVTTYKEVVVTIELTATKDMTTEDVATLTVTDVDVTNLGEEIYAVNDEVTVISGTVHVHNYVEVEDTDASVITKACDYDGCDAEKYELVEGSDLAGITETNELDKAEGSGYSINFDTDGGIGIIYSTTGESEHDIYLAKLDGDKVIELQKVTGETEVGKGDKGFVNEYKKGVRTIGEKVKAVFVEVNKTTGAVVSKSAVIEKSIAEYCETVIAGNYEQKHKDYCQALLDYASASQEYFDEKSGSDLINGGTYKTEFELTDSNNKFDRKGDSVWKFNGGNVSFTTNPVVRLYLTINDEESAANATFSLEYNGKTVTFGMDKLTATTVGTYECYYYDITDLAAKNVSQVIKLSTSADEYGEYSVDTYAYNMQNSRVGELAKLLVAYGDALAVAFPESAAN